MNLKNFCAVVILMLLIFIPKVEAAEKPRVMVTEIEIWGQENLDSSMAADFLIEHLVESNKFVLIEYEALKEVLAMQDLEPMDDDTLFENAKDLVANPNLDYIVYVDAISEPIFKGGNFKSIKTTIIVHMLDFKTGKIVTSAKGEGIYKRSEEDTPKNLKENVVPLICLRNAAYRAAHSAGDNLIKTFFEVKGA